MLQEKEEKKNILRDTLNLETLKRKYSSSEITNIKKSDLFPNTSIRLFDDDIKIAQSCIKNNNNNNYSQINEFFKIIAKMKKTNLFASTNKLQGGA